MNNLSSSPKVALSRRKFLGVSSLAGTAATLVGSASMSFFGTQPALAQEQPHLRSRP